MSKTAAELLRELDAKATAGPWRIAGAREYPWILGPADYRGDDTFTIIGDDGYGVLSVPVCLTDGPHAGNSACFVALRNALPQLAAVVERAVALMERVAEVLEYHRLHGGDPDYENALQDEHKGHHYDLTGLSNALDAALRDLTAALQGGER